MIIEKRRYDLYKRQDYEFGNPDENLEVYWSHIGNWFANKYELFYCNPALSIVRQYFGQSLYDLINFPDKIQEANRGIPDVFRKIALTRSYLTEALVAYGILTGREVLNMSPQNNQPGKMPLVINIGEEKILKYSSVVDECIDVSKRGGIVGGIFLTADPPHVGHSRLVAEVWPYCDLLICGIENPKLTNTRKGSPENRRPRYRQMGWRIKELAVIPKVDRVFISPIETDDNDAFLEMFRALKIKVVGCAYDNPLLPEYQRRMDLLGGNVVTIARKDIQSSTEIARRLKDSNDHRMDLIRFMMADHPDLTEISMVRRGFPQF